VVIVVGLCQTIFAIKRGVRVHQNTHHEDGSTGQNGEDGKPFLFIFHIEIIFEWQK
jgi:hypothetical protein